MNKKLFKKSAVCVLASVCMLSQSLGANAAALAGWKEENGVWKHYNESGNPSSGWISSNGLWYYIDSATGAMKQGWLDTPDGSRYFLDTEAGDTAGKMLTGWQWIDGYCYYFDRTSGKLVTNAEPEGYKVNAEGQWVDEEEKPLFDKEKGVKSTPQKSEAAKVAQAAGNGAVVRSGGGSGSSGGGSSRGGGNSSSRSGGSGSGASNKANEVKPENKPSVPDNKIENENKPSVPENKTENENKPSVPENKTENENKPSVPENKTENENKPSVPDNQGNNEKPLVPDAKEAELLDKKATRVITREIGWIKYVAIAFNQGKASDYNIYVDGTDISSAVTNVDTEGTIVKWLSTVKEPKQIKVVRKSDNLEDTAVLNKGEAAVSPEAGNPDNAPKYVFSNGPISTFDYNLDNYDKNGNIRKAPTRTTFSLDTAKEEKVLIGGEELVYYSPDIKIDDRGNGSGEIKFSLKNKAQEDWFNGITNIKALDYQYWHLNGELNFSKEISTAYGKTGVIKLSFPQSNLATRGKYNLSIESGAAEGSVSVPMHLIDNTVYKMQLSGSTSSPRTGEDILFNIISDSGRSFGNTIKNPVTRVVLTKPSGAEKDLEYIKEYSLIGDVFHIYGQDKNKKTVLLDEAGIYTITVYAEGYSVITTKVEVAQGDAVPAEAADTSFADYNIDALIKSSAVDTISSATGSARRRKNSGSGDGVSPGTESLVNPVNGYYLFNHDLLINALILNDIRPGNPDATAVARRWLINQRPAVLAGDNLEKLYDFDKYLDYVKTGRLNGEEPDFAGYIATNNGNDSSYTAVKYRTVLEDGLLGELKNRGDAIGKEAPALEGTTAGKGQSFVLTSQDADYIAAIKSLVVDGNSSALRSDSYLKQYSISEDKKTLTIYPSAFNSYYPKLVGKHTLRIEANGYQVNNILLTITNELEEVKFELRDNPKAKEGEDKHKYYAGQDVYINAASEANDDKHGNYLKSVYEVTLDGPGFSQKKVTSESEGALNGQDNYLKKDGSLVLQGGLFKKPGQYTVYVKAGEGYNIKTLSFEISAAAEEDTNPETPKDEAKKKTPVFKNAELISSVLSKYYLVEFDGLADNEIEAYLRTRNIKVFVNDVEYSRGVWGSNVYSIAEKGGNGVHKYLQLATTSFTKASNSVKIEAEGYETLIFNVANNSVQPEEPKNPQEPKEPEAPEKKAAPTFKSAELKSNWLGEKYYLAEFEGLSDNEIVSYFKVKNKKVFVNDVEYKENSYRGNAYWIVEAEGGRAIYKNLKLSTDAFTKAENTVKIEVEGYEALTFNVKNNSVQPEEPKNPQEPKEPEAPEKKAAPTLKKASYQKLFFDEYYLAEFEGLSDNEIVSYFKVKNKKVFVNDVEYKENSYRGNAYWIAEAAGGRGIYKNLKLSTDAFTKAENTVKIEVEGYEDLIFTVENSSVAPEQPEQKAAPEIETLKFVPGAYYPKMPVRYEIEFKDADSEEVAEYIKDNNFTVKVNEAEYSKEASVSGNAAQAFALEKVNGKTKFYLSADGFDRAVNTLNIAKEGYADLSFEFERKYEIKEVELVKNYRGQQYLEVRFGEVDRKELEYYLKDKAKVKITVNGQEYKGDRYDSNIPRKGEFSYLKDSYDSTPKAIKLSVDDLDLSSVEIVVSVEGFAEVSYHYSSDENSSASPNMNAFSLSGAADASLFGGINTFDAAQDEALEEKVNKDSANEINTEDNSSNAYELFDNFTTESEN